MRPKARLSRHSGSMKTFQSLNPNAICGCCGQLSSSSKNTQRWAYTSLLSWSLLKREVWNLARRTSSLWTAYASRERFFDPGALLCGCRSSRARRRREACVSTTLARVTGPACSTASSVSSPSWKAAAGRLTQTEPGARHTQRPSCSRWHHWSNGAVTGSEYALGRDIAEH